jgi:hypothetical protein
MQRLSEEIPKMRGKTQKVADITRTIPEVILGEVKTVYDPTNGSETIRSAISQQRVYTGLEVTNGDQFRITGILHLLLMFPAQIVPDILLTIVVSRLPTIPENATGAETIDLLEEVREEVLVEGVSGVGHV